MDGYMEIMFVVYLELEGSKLFGIYFSRSLFQN